jgi:TonB-linked SusC/RagA family outer membrane protein
MAFSMQFSFAQEKTVTGVVSDALGPLGGANVVVQGTTNGATTDFDGNYSIKAKQGDVLVFSYTGMKQSTATVGAANKINITMQEDVLTGTEVVVVGALGIKRKVDEITSSYQVVQSKELTQAVNPSVIQSLTGKVSGLQINTTSNGVNPDTRIVLRGNRSITGNNQALVVIDNAVSTANILGQLPPDVIESVNVIKGSQGAALYGEQGVNGVIIVTTKKGNKDGKMSVSINSSIDFSNVAFIPEHQDLYGQGWNTDPGFDDGTGNLAGFVPWENGAWGPAYNDPNMPAIVPVGLPQANGDFLYTTWTPKKDNIKDFFQTGTLFQNGISLNVGGADSYAMLSVNRQTTDFVVAGDELVRNSFLFKGFKKLGKFSLEGNVNYITQSTSQTDSNLYFELNQTATSIPVSRFAGGQNEHHWTVYYHSPYWKQQNIRFDNRSNIVNGIAALNYEFNKNISASYTGNIQVRNTDAQSHNNGFTNVDYEYNFTAPYTYYGASFETYSLLGGSPETSSFYANQSSNRNFYGDLLVNFDYKLTDDISAKFNIGNNIQDNMFRITTQGGTNLDVAGFYHISNVLNPDAPSTLDNRYVRSRKVAGFANADFGYKDYLFLNATARLEKSSTIIDSYFYPSVGVSFIPTKAFDIRGKVLNYAKVSANYVSVGNASAVGAYAVNDLASIPAGFPFGGLSGLSYNLNSTDPNIRPEFVNTTELSVNLGLFNDRVTIDGSIYTQDTKDLITRKTASSGSGNATVLGNVGDLENKGFEIDLGITPVKNDNFTWNMRASYSAYKTKVISLAEGINSVNLQSNTFVGVFAEVGEQFPLIKGTAYVRDANGNVIIDANGLPQRTTTFEKLGTSNPDYILGFTNSFEYKGLRFVTVMDYRTGHSTYSEVLRNLAWAGHSVESVRNDRDTGYIFPTQVETAPGSGVYTDNTTPVNGGGYAGTLNYFSGNFDRTGEALVIDATAFRVREMSLSYSLPSKMISNIGLESFRFGINARNPFTVLASENKGYTDPEASNTTGNAQGIANVGQYPTTRSYGFSINLTF